MAKAPAPQSEHFGFRTFEAPTTPANAVDKLALLKMNFKFHTTSARGAIPDN